MVNIGMNNPEPSKTRQITIDISEQMDATLTVLAGSRGISREALVSELLLNGMWQTAAPFIEQNNLHDLKPPVVRMANAILSAAIDLHATEVYITRLPKSVAVDALAPKVENGQQKQGDNTPSMQRILTGPLHLVDLLFRRYQQMTGKILARPSAVPEAAIPIVHNGARYNITAGFTDPREGGTETLRLKIQ